MGQAKVLIIEDDQAIVEMLEYNFGEAGYETVSALNGEKGVLAPETRQTCACFC